MHAPLIVLLKLYVYVCVVLCLMERQVRFEEREERGTGQGGSDERTRGVQVRVRYDSMSDRQCKACHPLAAHAPYSKEVQRGETTT